MTVTTNGGHNRAYACKCLNVRINSFPAPDESKPAEKDYFKLYVGDEGISVTHIQLTLRTRSRAKEEKRGDDTILTRYMSLTCLICQTLVYRVLQVITPDIDCGEGPMPPTEDWAENELLKTASGWIEVYKDCLAGDDVSKAETSPLYSRTFRILLPSGSSSSSFTAPVSSPSKVSPEQTTHLPALPPLFLPPPFTPSHSVFRHVSAVASEVSSKLREEAEEYLAKIVQDKVRELETAEGKLRAEVETIWLQWKRAISQAEQEANEKKRRSNNRRSDTFSRSTSPASPGSGDGLPASIRISSFVPQTSHNRSASVPHNIHSALSVSLATSTFHHPRVVVERNGSNSGTASSNGMTSPQRQPTSPGAATPSTQRAHSPATASSRTLAMNIPNEAISIREAYRRNMDESKDIATSFKYVMEMDQLAGQAALVPDASLIPTNTVPSVEDIPRGRSPQKSTVKNLAVGEASGSGINSQPTKAADKKDDHKPEKKSETKPKDEGVKSPVDSPSGKGKRKVTFVVNPDVTIIDDELTRERETKKVVSGDEEAAVFDFENEAGEREGEGVIDPLAHRNNNTEPTTPVEPIQAPRRPQRARKTDMSGLPSSLSALRPASLPMPSAMRPMLPQDTSSGKKADSTLTSDDAKRDEKGKQSLEYSLTSPAEHPQEELDSREAEILKLVAAHTPSHRSAWKKNSKAWQLFVSRQGKKKRNVDRIPEEDEDSTSSRAGYYDESDESTESDDRLPDPFVPLATSAPIPIAPIGQARNFGATSYQAKTSLSDRPGVLVPAFRTSSAALRKASYAERDRLRSIDPGIADFADDGDEEDEEEEEDVGDDANNAQHVGGRARRRALKILQARDSVPAAGMWRSLA